MGSLHSKIVYLQMDIHLSTNWARHKSNFADECQIILPLSQTVTQYFANMQQEGLAMASIARDVVVKMTPPRDDNAW